MRIAVVHYHFKPGGVTRVVRTAVDALAVAAPDIRVAALAGGPPPDPGDPLDWTHVPGLDYAGAGNTTDPRTLLTTLRACARDALGGPPDIWHVHNPTLGKNPAWPGWIQTLAEAGERLVLQPHDFAEDGRGANYTLLQEHRPPGTDLYPVADHIRWAPINQRDADNLRSAGLPERLLVSLPNPVLPPEPGEGRDCRPALGTDRLMLYPVRITRRKNLGELLLAAALAGPGTLWANTLDVTNPAEAAHRDHWRALIRALGLPVRLGLGTPGGGGYAFADLLASADQLVTTSVAEGFGLAFLEPWLLGKAITGRDLPAITRDFTGAGIRLPGLYERIGVPVDWIGADRLAGAMETGLRTTYAAYRRPVPEDALARCRVAWIREDGVDFGRLDETLQTRVIRRVAEDPAARDTVSGIPIPMTVDATVFASNRAIIHRQFSPEAYGRRLAGLYRNLAETPPGPVEALDPERILDCYLAPESLSLLRS